MFSKFSRHLILIAGLFLVGCQFPFSEKPPAQSSPVSQLGGKQQCLSNLMPTVKGFIRGDANPQDVGQIWDCFGGAILTFEQSVHGRDYHDRITSLEITNFFERYFLDGNTKISDRLRVEIFHFKQLFVGGDNDTITDAELLALVDFAKQMKQISLGLLPYMRVYSLNWQASAGYHNLQHDIDYFEGANGAIQDAAKQISQIIGRNNQSYEIQNFVVFLDELSKTEHEHWSFVQKIQNVLPLIFQLKKTLAGGSPTVVYPNDWRSFALLGGRGYIQYLRYFYFIENIDASGRAPEFAYIARSVEDLFSYFGDLVAEKPGAVFTKEDLYDVTSALTQFLPNFKVSKNFIFDVMKIKQLIFGGSLDQWTPDDFTRAKNKVSLFRSLTERFIAYSGLYTFSWETTPGNEHDDLTYFQSGESNLIEFAEKFGQIIEADCDFKDFYDFALEYDKLYSDAQSDPTRTTCKDDEAAKDSFCNLTFKYLPLITSYKNIVFTDNTSVVAKTQWSDLFKTFAHFYSRFVYYHYFVKPYDMSQGEGLANFNVLVNQTADDLDFVLSYRTRAPIHTITLPELSDFFQKLFDSKVVSLGLRGPTVQNFLPVLFQRILVPPEDRLAGNLPQGLSMVSTQVLRKEFSIWIENQRFAEVIFQGVPEDGGVSGSDILNDIQKAQPSDGLKELSLIYNSSWPLTYDSKRRLELGYKQADYNRLSANWINIARGVFRLVIRSYAGDISRVNTYTGVSLPEVQQLYNDVADIFVDTGILAQRSDTFAGSRFREASLFTANADGNEFVSIKEGSDVFIMILSGLRLGNEVTPKVAAVCDGSSLKDVDLGCLIKVYRASFSEVASSMPDMAKFADGLNDNDFKYFLLNLLKTSGYVAKEGEEHPTISLSDQQSVMQVAQYIESVMQRFDTQKKGFLSTTDALKAFPVFKNVLQKIADTKDEKRLLAAYAWILKYTKPPTSIWDKIKFITVWEPAGPSGWDIQADRQTLASILGYIAEASSPKTAKAVATFKNIDGEVKRQQAH